MSKLKAGQSFLIGPTPWEINHAVPAGGNTSCAQQIGLIHLFKGHLNTESSLISPVIFCERGSRWQVAVI